MSSDNFRWHLDFGRFHIEAIISRLDSRASDRKFTLSDRNGGQEAKLLSIIPANPVTMSIQVSGRAMRLVRRKCVGKLWK